VAKTSNQVAMPYSVTSLDTPSDMTAAERTSPIRVVPVRACCAASGSDAATQ
jgi:hypothetical protein